MFTLKYLNFNFSFAVYRNLTKFRIICKSKLSNFIQAPPRDTLTQSHPNPSHLLNPGTVQRYHYGYDSPITSQSIPSINLQHDGAKSSLNAQRSRRTKSPLGSSGRRPRRHQCLKMACVWKPWFCGSSINSSLVLMLYGILSQT